VVRREKQTILEYLRGLNLDRSALGSILLFTIAHRDWPSRSYLHCKEDSNYVFPEIELPNFHIQIPDRFRYSQKAPTYLLQPDRQTDRVNILISYIYMKVEIRTEAAQFPFWEFLPAFAAPRERGGMSQHTE
jgi:hypothetical protein